MSSIPIDHLGRDDLIILLNRVAARLSTVPGNHHPVGTPHTPISYESRNYATPNDILRPSMATNRVWRLRYEEEHDPWNAHLRIVGYYCLCKSNRNTDIFLFQLESRFSWCFANNYTAHRCNDVQVQPGRGAELGADAPPAGHQH